MPSRTMQSGPRPTTIRLGGSTSGEVSEWLKEQHWKCCWRLKPSRGFESPPLRFKQHQESPSTAALKGFLLSIRELASDRHRPRSNRSRVITLSHAATKSWTNFCCPSALA